MGRKSAEDQVISELNRALWQIDPIYAGREGTRAFIEVLRGFARQFNQAELARNARVPYDSYREFFVQRYSPGFVTMLRMLAVLGLRLRLERDPVPARAAYGSAHPKYKPRCDKDGAWDLGE